MTVDPQPNEQKPLSRQRLWQIKKKAEGKCPMCAGDIWEGSSSYCKKHHIAARERQRKRIGCVDRYINSKSYKIEMKETGDENNP